jgi:hypothetical protein
MDRDTVVGLDLVADDFEEGEHEKLDKELPSLSSVNSAQFILSVIVQQSGGHRLLKRYGSAVECKILLGDQRIYNMLLAGSKNGYKDVRLLSKVLFWIRQFHV